MTKEVHCSDQLNTMITFTEIIKKTQHSIKALLHINIRKNIGYIIIIHTNLIS